MMRTEHGLKVDISDRIARVQIDRPDRLNAISTGLMRELAATIDRLSRDDDVWVITLTGTGDRAFSAGMDLKEDHDGDMTERMRAMPMGGLVRNTFEVILECAKPTIAVLNGVAVGAGCEIALACDVRIAADTARIGLPEARRGMGANFGCQLLPRVIPRAIAYDLLYTGDIISAEEAYRIGLVSRLHPADRLEEEGLSLARRIARNAPMTVQRYKAMIGRGADLPISAALRLHVGPNPYTSEDRLEGVSAFMEKREPQWQAR